MADHLELLVEELSMEAFLRALLSRLLPAGKSFQIHAHQGKDDLLAKLEGRLRGYAAWLPEEWRILVVVDRDDSDCLGLKLAMEQIAQRAGLLSRTMSAGAPWQLVNRIAIEELEAWHFGDWHAVKAAYPRVSDGIPGKHGFRAPDQITGGTWEAFERVMKKHGYFPGGLAKIQAAREVAAHMDPARNTSPSFQCFWGAVMEALA